MEEDFLMKQFKTIGQSIGIILKKELTSFHLGEELDVNGQLVSRADLLSDSLDQNDFEGAFTLIDSLKYKLSYLDYTMLADWFINYLEKEKATLISDQQIQTFKEALNSLY
ncbi:hypothetical protein [Vagococcus zengguangii]|uniref:Uncharacterized protein n=1 Tax=Vagococcus zengguangii TaxID=2571750 RepID=A0A4D7D019_9ENTE|nr:hypothetical protein [Vagococcus zengguangii]QCI87106.1 hypothetical protein FA707_09195 [Vagococcus zengguangii]TLG78307.1 hypothetical protein FE258_09645 [Vagococcus zengguangii]